ncbi:hypothetical protein CSC94_06585 [Zhengella mangrovi]|uniref:Porin n=1 Tax=Zhengella mangrovi TaxID=1982044 RepID=A0A2G1QS51_9HYPH|nr:porin [Zhengella mangrovi]PHP68309.1 hypothetical protein CSC94_06585 [Zhengella mangrovi]
MNIKSLLLGSAAAMVAASAAQAADAVVYEPEPVEYVRVCDAYGAGFFYIPGTETCLSISGYVWLQVGGDSYRNALDTTPYYGGQVGNAGYDLNTRARLNIDARSDTEWGTLRSYIRLQGTWGSNADGNTTFDQAFLELGGLRMGYTESAWAQTQNGGASNWGSHSWGGMYYGYQQRHLIAYTFSGNGFAATLSLEHDEGPAATDWTPDVVGKVAYNAGWGAVWAKIGWDNAGAVTASGRGWGASVGMQYNIPNMAGDSLRLIYYYADSPNAYAVGGPVGGLAVPGVAYEHSILASYNHVFSPTLSASVAVQYFANVYGAVTGTKYTNDAWAGELSIVWTPVQNFEVRTELNYTDATAGSLATGDADGTMSGFIRFTRYF